MPGRPLSDAVRLWLMNSLGGQVFDLSNGYNGAFVGAQPPNWVVGENGPALNFPGIDGYLNCGVGVLDSLSQFTIIAHTRLTSLNNADALLGVRDDSTHEVGMVTAEPGIGDNDDVRISIENGAHAYGYTTANLNVAGVWVDWAMVFDGNGAANADRLKFYHNAILQSLTFNGIIPAVTGIYASPFSIGAWGAGTNDWTGDISYVYLFRRALVSSEVALLYREQFYMFPETIMAEYGIAA